MVLFGYRLHKTYVVCVCVVSSVLSFICDHFMVLIAIGAQTRGLFLVVFVAMVSRASLCIYLNRLFCCIYCNDYVTYVFIL
jgi:hypothetical protein